MVVSKGKNIKLTLQQHVEPKNNENDQTILTSKMIHQEKKEIEFDNPKKTIKLSYDMMYSRLNPANLLNIKSQTSTESNNHQNIHKNIHLRAIFTESLKKNSISIISIPLSGNTKYHVFQIDENSTEISQMIEANILGLLQQKLLDSSNNLQLIIQFPSQGKIIQNTNTIQHTFSTLNQIKTFNNNIIPKQTQ